MLFQSKVRETAREKAGGKSGENAKGKVRGKDKRKLSLYQAHNPFIPSFCFNVFVQDYNSVFRKMVFQFALLKKELKPTHRIILK